MLLALAKSLATMPRAEQGSTSLQDQARGHANDVPDLFQSLKAAVSEAAHKFQKQVHGLPMYEHLLLSGSGRKDGITS